MMVKADAEEVKKFIQSFSPTNLKDDPLPVKVPKGQITKHESVGQAVLWAYEYLHNRSCPFPLVQYILKLTHENAVQKLNNPMSIINEGDCTDGGNVSTEDSEGPLHFMHGVVETVDNFIGQMQTSEEGIDQILTTHCSPLLLDQDSSQSSQVSFYKMKNARRTMEDKMIIITSLQDIFKIKENLSFFSVFDGHNGVEAATFGAAQLHKLFGESLESGLDIAEALSVAFKKTDEEFMAKCRKENIRSGSTIGTVVVSNEKIVVAWAGDCLASLHFGNGEAKQLVLPHKPDRKDEQKRILSQGAEVMEMNGMWRVNGTLAITRAMGDPEFKNYVVCDPEIIEIDRKNLNDEYIVLASDGLWDYFNAAEVGDFINRLIIENKSQEVAQLLSAEAKSKGSQDNISIIVVYLKPLNVLTSLIQERGDKGVVTYSGEIGTHTDTFKPVYLDDAINGNTTNMNQDNLQSNLVSLRLCDSDKDGESDDDSSGNEWSYNNFTADSTIISNQPNPPPATNLIQELQGVQQHLPMDMESSNDQPMPLIDFGEPIGIQMTQVETVENMPIKIASDILELASLDQNTAILTANPPLEKLEDHQQQVATTSSSEKLSVDVVVSNVIEKKKSPAPLSKSPDPLSKSPDKKQPAASLASKPGVKKPLPDAKTLKKPVDSVGAVAAVSKAPISSRLKPKPPTTTTSPPKKAPLVKQPPPPLTTSTKTTTAKPTTVTNVSKPRTVANSEKPPIAVVKKTTTTLPLKNTLKSPTKASDLPSDKAKTTTTTTTTKPSVRATPTSITRTVPPKGLANGHTATASTVSAPRPRTVPTRPTTATSTTTRPARVPVTTSTTTSTGGAGPGRLASTAKKALTSTLVAPPTTTRVTRPAPKTTTTGSVRPPTTAAPKTALTNGGTRPVQKKVNGTTTIKPTPKPGGTKKTTIHTSSPIKDVKINPSKPEGENLIIDEPIIGEPIIGEAIVSQPIVDGPIIGEPIINDQNVAEPIIDIVNIN